MVSTNIGYVSFKKNYKLVLDVTKDPKKDLVLQGFFLFRWMPSKVSKK
jgi:hypothetical protein